MDRRMFLTGLVPAGLLSLFGVKDAESLPQFLGWKKTPPYLEKDKLVIPDNFAVEYADGTNAMRFSKNGHFDFLYPKEREASPNKP